MFSWGSLFRDFKLKCADFDAWEKWDEWSNLTEYLWSRVMRDQINYRIFTDKKSDVPTVKKSESCGKSRNLVNKFIIESFNFFHISKNENELKFSRKNLDLLINDHAIKIVFPFIRVGVQQTDLRCALLIFYGSKTQDEFCAYTIWLFTNKCRCQKKILGILERIAMRNSEMVKRMYFESKQKQSLIPRFSWSRNSDYYHVFSIYPDNRPTFQSNLLSI